jgi:hypothetical protein
MGFRTIPEALRAASKAAGDAIGELRGADCGGPVGGVTAALPGGNASGAASSFSNSWQTAFKNWCTEGDQCGAALAKAADTYQAGDHAAANAASDAGKLRGPR